MIDRDHRESKYRKPFRPVIEKVLSEFAKSEQRFGTVKEREKALKAALNKAYPFGGDKPGNYALGGSTRRIWLDEVKRARGLKPPLWTRKTAVEDVRKLVSHERLYGTKESLDRILRDASMGSAGCRLSSSRPVAVARGLPWPLWG